MVSFINTPPRDTTIDTFYQPQLTRYHHSFRSPMESERLNLEAAQLRFDITTLYAKINALIASLDTVSSTIQNGSSSEIHSVSWISMATPTPTLTTMTSLQVVAQLVERLSTRLRVLENK